MMVTDIESLPRGGMGGVVHTVGTVENSQQKISQTKLILKCPLSKEFARSTYKGDQDFHLKGRQRCHQLPGWTRCRGTPHNNYQPSRAIVFVQFLRPLLAIVDILTKGLHLFFVFTTCFHHLPYQ